MAISIPNEFVFEVRRSQPELVCPAKATPHEFKQLSDIDDQESLRFQTRAICFYGHNPRMEGIDPVQVIKKALAETLVFYYPFAGRLREGPGRKLFVECTAEGVLFIEADAEAKLEQFGDVLRPPFACLDDVLYNVPNSDGIINSPLALIQVTRFKCGGFSFGIRVNHTMCDGPGFFQFVWAVAEIARGACAPSILPVWQRALLNARDPPRVSFQHHEYDQVMDTKGIHTNTPLNAMVQRSVFFGQTHISTLRKMVSSDLQHCSSFDLITACLWRTRTIALQPDPNEEMRLLCMNNLRSKLKSLPLGYYGNAFVFPAVVATAGKLIQNSLTYIVELVRKAKSEVTEEYIKSVADLMVIKGRPYLAVGSFEVSDVTQFGSNNVDFGWGKTIYGGIAIGRPSNGPDFTNYYIRCKNSKGEEGTLVSLSLPAPAMQRFVVELEALFKTNLSNDVENSKRPLIQSGL